MPMQQEFNSQAGARVITPEAAQALLFEAVLQGDAPTLRALIEAGVSVDARSADCDDTPLTLAAARNDLKMAKELLELGADANAVNELRISPLQYALKNGNNALVALLVEQGAVLSAGRAVGENAAILLLKSQAAAGKGVIPVDAGGSILEEAEALKAQAFAAVTNDDEKALSALLSRGVPPGLGNDAGETLAMQATRQSRLSILKDLALFGADLDAVDSAGETALTIAAETKNADAVALLLEYGAQEGIAGTGGIAGEVMRAAIKTKLGKAVKAVLKSGIDPDALLDNFACPLVYAVRGGANDIAATLLKAGARLPDEKAALADAALAIVKSGDAEAVGILLAATGDDTLDEAARGRLLHAAAGQGYADITRMIVEKWPYTVREAVDGRSPLHTAAESRHTDTVKALLDAGADPRFRVANGPRDCEALAFCGEAIKDLIKEAMGRFEIVDAAAAGDVEKVKQLLNDGRNPGIVDYQGKTPLMYASENGYTGVVRQLIAHGAGVKPRSPKGETALQSAFRKGHGDIVETLFHAGGSVLEADASGVSPAGYVTGDQRPKDAPDVDPALKQIVLGLRECEFEAMARKAVRLDSKVSAMKKLRFRPASA